MAQGAYSDKFATKLASAFQTTSRWEQRLAVDDCGAEDQGTVMQYWGQERDTVQVVFWEV